MKYFSQNGEDMLLWEVFKGQSSGYFIDVGAFDGIHLSNSYSFELEGWRGICVEANPEYFPVCLKNRPLSLCLNFACTCPEKRGQLNFKQEPLGMLSGLEADKTLNLEERYARRNLIFKGFTSVKVQAITLDDIISTYLPDPNIIIDFISIDVEGTELDVLQGLTALPRILIVETHTLQQGQIIESYLIPKGYSAGRILGENIFFARNVHDLNILRQAEVCGRTENTLHPLGEAATLKQQVGKQIIINKVC